jgi:di/tricarboxylate transporter
LGENQSARAPTTAAGRFDRFYIALLISVGMVVVAASVKTPQGAIELVIPAAFAVGLMLAFGVTTRKRAHQAIDWHIIITVAAFGLAAAMTNTNVAAVLGKAITDLAVRTNTGQMGVLAAVMICTEIVAALITAKAAAVIMFPIAATAAARLHIDPIKMLIALMLGASDFTTPQGHQTNLMVMGPGAYKFFDYQKLGLPLEVFLNVVQLLCLYYYDQWYVTTPIALLFFALCIAYDHVVRNHQTLRSLFVRAKKDGADGASDGSSGRATPSQSDLGMPAASIAGIDQAQRLEMSGV